MRLFLTFTFLVFHGPYSYSQINPEVTIDREIISVKKFWERVDDIKLKLESGQPVILVKGVFDSFDCRIGDQPIYAAEIEGNSVHLRITYDKKGPFIVDKLCYDLCSPTAVKVPLTVSNPLNEDPYEIQLNFKNSSGIIIKTATLQFHSRIWNVSVSGSGGCKEPCGFC